jgi:thiopeptide-type bacteriocin biosynthesis protein
MPADACGFRSGDIALLRAVAQPDLGLPSWPDLTGVAKGSSQLASQLAWLRAVIEAETFGDQLRYAAPDLVRQAGVLCGAATPAPSDVRRAVLSVARYALRSQGRPTPFGLFAGVTTVTLGVATRAEWGSDHRAVIAAAPGWLADVTARLETCPELLSGLPVIANGSVMVRGDRLIVPYQANAAQCGTGPVDISLRNTAPVAAALAAAQTPIRVCDLAGKLVADFPAAGSTDVAALIAELIARNALISALRLPGTETDPLGYLLSQLDAADAAAVPEVTEIAAGLRDVHARLMACNARPVDAGRAARADLADRMRQVQPGSGQPLVVNLRLDAAVVLPKEVALEAENAAWTLARLSAAPFGTACWKRYHQRFYERFGLGSLVPLLDVVADSGIGFPDGYQGSAAGGRRSPLSDRDEVLIALAQRAALDGLDEVVLGEQLIRRLEQAPGEVRLPPHLEVGIRVHAATGVTLDRGDFWIEVVSVSRGAGVGTGRFLTVLDSRGRAAMAGGLADLPCVDDVTAAAQLSFPPLVPATAHLTRSPQVLPALISVQEHRVPAPDVLTLADLAVGCDGRRMYLAVPSRGYRVEAVAMHALSLHAHTPPLARFLIELSRAQCAAVTLFDWGAARAMPFLPRLRYGRTVLSPARWHLDAGDLPARSAPWPGWDQALTAWQAARRLPRRVGVTEADRYLPLDLEHPGHRAILRAELGRSGKVVLTEALQRFGWCDDRPHEVVIPLKAAAPSGWPRLPKPSPARVISRGQGQSPARSPVVLASLYGDIRRQDVILADHLPVLLDRLGQPPWWYVRFRDPDQHLRVRVAIPDHGEFGRVATILSSWSDELRDAGLLSEVRYPTSYPETGRWGSGAAWDAAEEVFRADSRLLLVQLRQPTRPHRRALFAAHAVAIASAFCGSTVAGARWLMDHVPAAAPEPVPRPIFAEAVRVADPSDNWAALRSAPGGTAIAGAWAGRHQALASYRSSLVGPGAEGIDVDDVLNSLLHVHFVRAVAIDFREEACCLHLARAAAVAWTARTREGSGG